MQPIVIDFETYYDREYSVAKMTTQEYVRDVRFEVICVSVKVGNAEPVSFTGTMSDTKKWLRQFDWGNALMIAHNVLFDGAILAFVFGIIPKMYFCTMMGARPWYAPFIANGRTSLAKTVEYLSTRNARLALMRKGTEVGNAIGKRRSDFSDYDMQKYIGYCENDVTLCYELFLDLVPKFPKDELRLLDLTIRKFTQPMFELDMQVIEDALASHLLHKATVLEKCGLQDRENLMSNDKFAAILKLMGVDPPTKVSPRTGKVAYAFAKTDQGMKDLLDHPNEDVQLLVTARLAHKSTIFETRLERFKSLARLGGKFSIPLLYYGAHTGRLSGWDKLNLQNLTRGSELRRAMRAPEGFKVVAGDLSNIEARVLAVLAGQMDLVGLFRNNEDVYCKFATVIFGRQITKADFIERFLGKTTVLGCGYGTGGDKLYATILQNPDASVTVAEAHRIVDLYRTTYPKIPALWREAHSWLVFMVEHGGKEADAVDYKKRYGPLVIHSNFEGNGGAIELPNGMPIFYPELYKTAEGGYKYKSRTGWKDIWGGAVVENVTQALARIIISEAELYLARRGWIAANQVHDELIYIVANALAEKFGIILEKVLCRQVPWMPQLPVAAEIGIGDNYCDAK
jgi:hypothetical protein